MIALQRHIETLLLENDCVIVPGFGGFVTHWESARYVADEHTFYPPLRTLGFNPQLLMNDSVLVHSYIEAYDISYPEALRRVESEVAQLKAVLSEQGFYVLDSIGTLSVNQEGRYTFEPCEAGVLTPELYGLGSFQMPRLKDIPAATAMSAAATEPTVAPVAKTAPALLDFTDAADDDDHRAIEIKLSWIRNTVAVAAAVLALFLMVTPVANGDLSTQNMSTLSSDLLNRLMPKDTNAVPKAQPVAEAQPAAEVQPVEDVQPVAEVQPAEDVQPTAEAQPAVVAKPKTTYCIVVASQVRRDNADRYVEQLHQRGYQQARVLTHDNIVRVISGEYDSEAEAYRQLNKMNTQEEFFEAWVYRMKN